MLKYFDDILGKDLSVIVLLEFLFYFAVRITPDALPLAILLSSIMTFGNLGENNELVAIKSSGVSLIRTLFPLFIISVLITFFAFFSNNNFVPKANLKALSLLYDIKRKKPSMDLKEGQFYNGIPGYTIKVQKKISDELLKGVIIYDHVTYPGNNRVILSDSSYMYSVLNNRYLIFELFDGFSFSEVPSAKSKVKKINQFYRNEFSKMKIVFDMSSFDLERTKEELFAGDYRMKNISQLSSSIDSLSYYRDKQKYIMLKTSNTFYKYHMKNKFIFPSSVDYIRKELKEETLVLDYFTYNDTSKLVLDSEYILNTINLNNKNDVYLKALNTARNIKTNLSINTAKIKAHDYEINKNKIELLKKYAQAFACISMFLIGAPLGSLIKKGGIGIPVIISIFFYIIYYVLNILGLKWAREAIISPELAAWLSNLVLLPIGLFLLYHTRKDSKIFDKDYYVSYFNKFIRIYKNQ
jgi:lipopolysaccharide export system permease protein|tara:strand:- start:15 stop:1418 length:1404 start_codon:yes stop_codon:yes gene_type:complete